jgi:hypothetical protein
VPIVGDRIDAVVAGKLISTPAPLPAYKPSMVTGRPAANRRSTSAMARDCRPKPSQATQARMNGNCVTSSMTAQVQRVLDVIDIAAHSMALRLFGKRALHPSAESAREGFIFPAPLAKYRRATGSCSNTRKTCASEHNAETVALFPPPPTPTCVLGANCVTLLRTELVFPLPAQFRRSLRGRLQSPFTDAC